MTALVQAISQLSSSTTVETETLKVFAIFCGAVLLVSILKPIVNHPTFARHGVC